MDTASVVWLIIVAAFCTLLPIGLLLWWRRTRKAKLAPFFVGALIFVVFARGLEALLHYACLLTDNPVSRAINGNTWLYVLYGALAAGIFEETGRYVAFRFLLPKKRFPERDTAVTCGIGHGGAESILLIGVTFGLYAAIALMTRTGNHEQALALTKGDAAALSLLLGQIGEITPGACIFNMIERVFAIILHIGLSIYVFLAVRDRTQRSWFPFAVALHAIADMPAALYQRGVLPVWSVELWLAVVSLYTLRSARKCYLELTDP
ncbi:MAG: YhfC family intramembrane metalloprotease [Oscillospiraceae bacterium]|nr:YhfC family intramembrane metalloprotease [Oscillospiraceae bacterium]